MKKLVVGDCTRDHLYQLVDPDGPNEAEFELATIKALSCLYADYHCILFGGSFRLDDRVFKPDLALIEKTFSHWFIIEVELVSHSFAGHVLPQVRAFRFGEAQPDCVSVLARELAITRQQAETLLHVVPRHVAVVANRHDERWGAAFDAIGVQLLVLSRYRSQAGVDAIEMDGALRAVEEHLGFGVYSAADRSLVFPRSVRLPLGKVQIDDPSGATSLWTVVANDRNTWVTKDIGVANLADGAFVQLLRTVGGRIMIGRTPERRGAQ